MTVLIIITVLLLTIAGLLWWVIVTEGRVYDLENYVKRLEQKSREDEYPNV